MHNVESCSMERLSAHARGIGERNALDDASSRFASYLRAFGKFFQLYTTKLRSGTAQLSRVYCGQFPLAPASAAFV
jgi:hypothetical protein